MQTVYVLQSDKYFLEYLRQRPSRFVNIIIVPPSEKAALLRDSRIKTLPFAFNGLPNLNGFPPKNLRVLNFGRKSSSDLYKKTPRKSSSTVKPKTNIKSKPTVKHNKVTKTVKLPKINLPGIKAPKVDPFTIKKVKTLDGYDLILKKK